MGIKSIFVANNNLLNSGEKFMKSSLLSAVCVYVKQLNYCFMGVKSKLFRTAARVSFIITITLLNSNVWAGLIIDISEGSGGSTVFELTGTGTVLGINGGDPTAALINIVTSSDTFLVENTSTQIDATISSSIVLGSATTSRIFLSDLNGEQGINSRLGFGVFGGGISVGDSLSDLNGAYLANSITFSAFVAGTYSARLGFLDTHASVTDVGPIMVNVAGSSVVPVPTAVWLFGSGLLGLVGVARRKA